MGGSGISQGRADDGEEGGNGIGRRRNGGHTRVDGYMLILSIRRTIVHERVHGRRKRRAAACSLGNNPYTNGFSAEEVAMSNVTLIGWRLEGEDRDNGEQSE